MRRDPYVTRILVRQLSERPEVTQYDLAAALDCDRSRIAHQVAGRQAITADEVDAWCSVLGSDEAMEAMARRRRKKLVPLDEQPEPAALERSGHRLLGAVGRFGAQLGEALEDGRLDGDELARLRADIDAVEAHVAAIKARLGAKP